MNVLGKRHHVRGILEAFEDGLDTSGHPDQKTDIYSYLFHCCFLGTQYSYQYSKNKQTKLSFQSNTTMKESKPDLICWDELQQLWPISPELQLSAVMAALCFFNPRLQYFEIQRSYSLVTDLATSGASKHEEGMNAHEQAKIEYVSPPLQFICKLSRM